MFEKCLNAVKIQSPLIHTITNAVTMNDVANMLLACGARPLMSDDPVDIEEITSITDGLVLNLGMLNPRKYEGMLLAGEKARSLGHSIVLDPAGVGVSAFRLRAAKELLRRVKPDAVRGNLSEIRMLLTNKTGRNGVDADASDVICEQNKEKIAAFAGEAAEVLGCIVCVTGAIDFVSDGKQCFAISNGSAEMSKVTGTGCQLSALVGAYLAANPKEKLQAVAAAAGTMGVAGELARERMLPHEGNASYRNRMIDAVYHMDEKILKRHARLECMFDMDKGSKRE